MSILVSNASAQRPEVQELRHATEATKNEKNVAQNRGFRWRYGIGNYGEKGFPEKHCATTHARSPH